MKLLIISDGHGDLEKLKRIKPVAGGVDALIFGGDFAAFKKIETGAPFLNELLKIHKNIFAVLGNCACVGQFFESRILSANDTGAYSVLEDFFYCGANAVFVGTGFRFSGRPCG